MQDVASCSHSFYNEYFYVILFILAVLGLGFWGGFSLVTGSGAYSVVAVVGFSFQEASLVGERQL